jgi:DNA-binding NtrC family response regulator
LSSFKVLIVDDDEEYISTLKELLERSQFTVITAYSGEEALEKFKNNPDIRLAIIDLIMPMMDGITLLEKLKKNDNNLSIIMITGQGTVSNAVEALKKGANDFITKPFDKDVLLSKLEIFRKSYELFMILSFVIDVCLNIQLENIRINKLCHLTPPSPK